jgi:hypothetical protein
VRGGYGWALVSARGATLRTIAIAITIAITIMTGRVLRSLLPALLAVTAATSSSSSSIATSSCSFSDGWWVVGVRLVRFLAWWFALHLHAPVYLFICVIVNGPAAHLTQIH